MSTHEQDRVAPTEGVEEILRCLNGLARTVSVNRRGRAKPSVVEGPTGRCKADGRSMKEVALFFDWLYGEDGE
jgi:hypothetical protein